MDRIYIVFIVCFLSLVTAGCVDPEVAVSVEELNNTTEVTESASIDLENTNQIVEKAVLEGRSDPTFTEISDELLVLYDGKYYDILKRSSDTGRIIIADINVSETNSSANYKSDELSKKDVEPIRDFERYEDKDYPRPIISQVYTPNDINESVLLKKEDVIVSFQGKNYQLSINRTKERTENMFTYSSEVRFENSDRYYDYIEDNYIFELKKIPNGSEEVWNKAIESGYFGKSTEGFKKLKERFEKEDAFQKEEYNGQWYVRYNKEIYKVDMNWNS